MNKYILLALNYSLLLNGISRKEIKYALQNPLDSHVQVINDNRSSYLSFLDQYQKSRKIRLSDLIVKAPKLYEKAIAFQKVSETLIKKAFTNQKESKLKVSDDGTICSFFTPKGEKRTIVLKENRKRLPQAYTQAVQLQNKRTQKQRRNIIPDRPAFPDPQQSGNTTKNNAFCTTFKGKTFHLSDNITRQAWAEWDDELLDKLYSDYPQHVPAKARSVPTNSHNRSSLKSLSATRPHKNAKPPFPHQNPSLKTLAAQPGKSDLEKLKCYVASSNESIQHNADCSYYKEQTCSLCSCISDTLSKEQQKYLLATNLIKSCQTLTKGTANVESSPSSGEHKTPETPTLNIAHIHKAASKSPRRRYIKFPRISDNPRLHISTIEEPSLERGRALRVHHTNKLSLGGEFPLY